MEHTSRRSRAKIQSYNEDDEDYEPKPTVREKRAAAKVISEAEESDPSDRDDNVQLEKRRELSRRPASTKKRRIEKVFLKNKTYSDEKPKQLENLKRKDLLTDNEDDEDASSEEAIDIFEDQKMIGEREKEQIMIRLKNIETRLTMSEVVWKTMIQTTLRLQHDVEKCKINEKATHTLIKIKSFEPLKTIPELPIRKVWEFQLLEKLVSDNQVMAGKLGKIFADMVIDEGQDEGDWISRNLNQLLDPEIAAIYNVTDYSDAEGHNFRDMKIIEILANQAMDMFVIERETAIEHIKIWFASCLAKKLEK